MKDANALNRGLWLGLAGIVIFAATLPLTRLAVGTPETPHMSSIFVALARAALAASLAGLYLLATRAPWPQRHEWRPLALVALGVVLGLLETLTRAYLPEVAVGWDKFSTAVVFLVIAVFFVVRPDGIFKVSHAERV